MNYKYISSVNQELFVFLRGRHIVALSQAWTTCTDADRSCCLSWRKGKSSPHHHLLPLPLCHIHSPVTTPQRFVPCIIQTDYSDYYLICWWLCFCLQYGDESSKNIMKCREPDYAGQYSPWSCETIGSYIGSKDAKPKDVMVSGAMEMMVMNWWIFQHSVSAEKSAFSKFFFCFAFFIRMWRLKS